MTVPTPSGRSLEVFDVAQTTLDWVVDHFAAARITLPELRYIAAGATRSIAWDCESVLVTSAGIGWGINPSAGAGTGKQTGQSAQTQMRFTIVNIQIVRPYPNVGEDGVPDPKVHTDAAEVLLTDAGALSQALVELAGPRGPLRAYGMVTAGDVTILGPDGAFSATEGGITVTAAKLSRA